MLELSHLGTAIRHFRLRLNMSQQELADRARIHRTYLSDLENGRRHVTVGVIAVVAEGLHIKVSKLLSYAEKISEQSEEEDEEP